MKKEQFKFLSDNGKTMINTLRYVPDGEIKAVLQIAHGMVEFIERYDDFMTWLCNKGYLVTGNDHLGHGDSIDSKEDWGFFGENGFWHVLKDMHQLTKITKEAYPGLPYFLLGHSMGSFFARAYLGNYGEELTGAIIMGTGFEPQMTVRSGMFLCQSIAAFRGWHYRSKLVNGIAFGSYNDLFKPQRTPFDWLSKDETVVDKYMKEPRNSFTFTVNGFYNMFALIDYLYDKDMQSRVPKDLPIFFVSGKDDPVGTEGMEVYKSADHLKSFGVKNIEVKLYENDRHEILNETDKLQVYADLYEWMERNR